MKKLSYINIRTAKKIICSSHHDVVLWISIGNFDTDLCIRSYVLLNYIAIITFKWCWNQVGISGTWHQFKLAYEVQLENCTKRLWKFILWNIKLQTYYLVPMSLTFSGPILHQDAFYSPFLPNLLSPITCNSYVSHNPLSFTVLQAGTILATNKNRPFKSHINF